MNGLPSTHRFLCRHEWGDELGWKLWSVLTLLSYILRFEHYVFYKNCIYTLFSYVLCKWRGKQLGKLGSFQIRSDQLLSRADSLRPHESQQARPPCPSPTPGVHSDSRPSSQWCHPAISSSVVPFSCPPIPPSIRIFSNESTLHMRWAHVKILHLW